MQSLKKRNARPYPWGEYIIWKDESEKKKKKNEVELYFENFQESNICKISILLLYDYL